jgi:hypothetical protein
LTRHSGAATLPRNRKKNSALAGRHRRHKGEPAMTKTLAAGLLVLALLGLSPGADAFLGLGGTSWKEEVLLHDGRKIVVERNMTRHGRHEPGRTPPMGDQSIKFNVPGTHRMLTWRDEYSEDVGSANFNLIALHILNGTPYIVNTAYGCISYNKWGRPNPPYIIFKHDGNAWQRISLTELPIEFKTVNLLIGPSNEEKRLSQSEIVSVKEIEKLNKGYSQTDRAILREALPQQQIIAMCGDMVLYRGHWIMRNSEPAKWRIDRLLDQAK